MEGNNRLGVTVLQVENRINIKYMRIIASINQVLCQKLGYNYNYLFMQEAMINKFHGPNKSRYRAAQCAKLGVMSEFLNTSTSTTMIFLDSDAWIENPSYLYQLVNELNKNKSKQGCFSRDPYRLYYTYINSGSFILKINDYTRDMYTSIINNFFHRGKSLFPLTRDSFDQYYISESVYENKEDFFILKPDIINTPKGRVLRHDWRKEKELVEADIVRRYELLIDQSIDKDSKFNFSGSLDLHEYPNLER
jgi:hypothetical protein